MRLENKTIWITGASSGVGEGMAHVFHREGANLIISGRRVAELERVREACRQGPGRIMVLPFDITNRTEREAAAKLAMNAFDRID
ncbi:MAG: SDR family NAD(P)-dependent oxidoreductase, partial [Gammaproteobacteria bacterium]|nr:SDR family NAD(P)-dependent oxidoreductase [Gammaproteobacteria bacterium]